MNNFIGLAIGLAVAAVVGVWAGNQSNKVASMEREAAKLTSAQTATNKSLEDVQAKLAEASEKLKAAGEQAVALTKERDTAMARVTRLADTVDALEEQTGDMASMFEKNAAKLRLTEESLSENEKSSSATKAEAAKLKTDLSVAQKKISALNETVGSAQSAMRKLRNEVTAFASEREDMQSQLEATLGELEKARDELEAVSADLEQERKAREDAEKALEEAQAAKPTDT